MTEVLRLDDLRVVAPSGDCIVDGVSLSLRKGEVLGLVGESGSGKTTTAFALLGHANAGARITGGAISVAGEVINLKNRRSTRRQRGRVISFIPQSPGTALNPSMSIGGAIAEMLRAHGERHPSEDTLGGALGAVGLPSNTAFQRRFPHQLSGGQQQRVCIAVALVSNSPVVVLDEPTTGLDVVTQAHILAELKRLQQDRDLALVYVTHDLAVLAQIATRVAVMYAGHIVEQGPAQDILRHPRHPYTAGLLKSVPDHVLPRALDPMPGIAPGIGSHVAGCPFRPRCSLAVDACATALPEMRPVGPGHDVRCLRAEKVLAVRQPVLQLADRAKRDLKPVLEVSHLRAEHVGRGETVVAASDLSFCIGKGECVALVGESGSGKTTVARTIVGLHPIAGGEISLLGQPVTGGAKRRPIEQRQQIQMIFQDPSNSLNPKQTIRTAIARPAAVLRGLRGAQLDDEVDRLFDVLRLPRGTADHYPMELSGGERQRIGIARALAADPLVIVCDEITSALDVSVQAAVLQCLNDLREELGLALLFITHDLGVVATIADQVLVLERGEVCEQGPVEAILHRPQRPYTQRLLAAAPSISSAVDRSDWHEGQGRDPARPTDESVALGS